MWLLGLILLLYLGWRMVRPMNIFTITDEFAFPIAETRVPAMPALNAATCGACHQKIYREWQSSIHAQAWQDPLFQAYNRHDGYQQICLNCHTPLQNQQRNLVKGHRDRARKKPILVKNPDFSPTLRREGVTCAACHVRNGKIHGPFGNLNAPHPSVQDSAFIRQGEVCKRCHLVDQDRWDTFFYSEGPCGTYEDLKQLMIKGVRKDVGCYSCHMPAVDRPLIPGWPVRPGRSHLWRGGHSPEMVSSALDITFRRSGPDQFQVTLLNKGAGHRLPTGAPMRYLLVSFRSYDAAGKLLRQKNYRLRRNVIWRPFVIDLPDGRLEPYKIRKFQFEPDPSRAQRVEARVGYHLMPEKERREIRADRSVPIEYELFRQELPVKMAVRPIFQNNPR